MTVHLTPVVGIALGNGCRGATFGAIQLIKCGVTVIPLARQRGLAWIAKNYQKLIAFKRSLPCFGLETIPPWIRQNIR
jgi:hypothetical protein